jgi:hypothetical protein
MPRGGARKGSGNKKGVKLGPQRAKIDASPAAMHALEKQTRSPAQARLCKDILAEYANFCAGMASQFQPRRSPDGTIAYQQGHEEIFLRYMDRACMFATRAAPYQSPTFKAIMVTPPPEDPKDGKNMRVVNLTVFDAVGVAVASEVVEEAKR